MDAVFLSDLHLKSLEERNGKTLLRFFRSLEERPEQPPQIFLLGDIFDLWVSDHRVFVDRYAPLLESLERLVVRGALVIYFEGNHDLHLGNSWKSRLQADVRTTAGFFKINALTIRCEHGDEINREDIAYLRLRAFLRHPFMEMVAHRLPGSWLDAIGQRWSKHSRKTSGAERVAKEQRIRTMLRSYAERIWQEEPFDVLISGHMHVKDDWSFQKEGRSVRAINLGSWFQPPQVLVLKGREWTWLSLD